MMTYAQRLLERFRAVAQVSGFLSVVLACGMVAASDWATYRADIARSGAVAQGPGSKLALHWTCRPLQPPHPAWPPPAEELPRTAVDNAFHVALAGGTVYFGSSVTNKVCAVDAAEGIVRWTFFAEGPVRFAPTVSGARVYFGSDDGYVYCLDAAAGTLVWKHRAAPSGEKVIGNGRMISLWPVRASVLVDDGVVYSAAGVFPYEGLYISALDAADGSVVWINDTVGDRAHELEFGGLSPHGYLLASAEILYVPSGRAMPAAFDRKTGKFLFWASPGAKRGGTWALLDKNRLIAGVDLSGVPHKVAYDAKSGQPQGDMFAWFPGIDMVTAPEVTYVVTLGGVYAINQDAYAKATAESGKLDVERKELGAKLAGLKKKQAGGGDSAGADELQSEIKKLGAKIGALAARQQQLRRSVYSWQFPGKGFCAVIRAGDTVFVGGQAVVVGLDAATGAEVWRHEVDGRAVGLAATGQELVVSTDTGSVACFRAEGAGKEKALGPALAADPYGGDATADTYRAAAEKILADTGARKGYCLVLDCGEGGLAYELARQSELQVVGLEKDPAKLTVARARLEAAGLLGGRIVVEPWDLETLPDWFANLIVSDGMLRTGQTTTAPEEQRRRLLRPWGGVEYLSVHDQDKVTWKRFERGPLAGTGSWTQQYADPQNTACSNDEQVNGPLGILWFGEPGPQGMVERHGRAQAPVAMDGRLFVEGEQRIMAVDAFNGTLLWEREIPGAVRVKVQADSGNMVVTAKGLYVAAHDKCYRLDPATGKTLRVYQLPAADRRWGYISVVGDVLYGSAATTMKQQYGAVLKLFLQDGKWKDPADVPADQRPMYEHFKRQYPDPAGFRLAAERSGLLYRSMTSFGPGGEFQQGNAVTSGLMTSDQLFAIDTESGELLWAYDGKQIANITVVLGEDKIFLARSGVTAEQRSQALAERRELIRQGVYKERDGILAELAKTEKRRVEVTAKRDSYSPGQPERKRLDRLVYELGYVIQSLRAELFKEENPAGTLSYEDADVRLVVALDARTGKQLWARAVDLTGCCGDRMGAAYRDGLLLFFGNYGNHDAWRFRVGGLKWRRITTLAADTGATVWSRPLNYRTRPVLVGDRIIVEPRACYLRTGETVMRVHPTTGRQTPWEFLRPGHTCGITAASAEGLFYRSASTAFYDLARDPGVTIFGGYRPGCAISVIPASGVLLAPEASAGCTCSYPIRCSLALKRKPKRQQPWTVYIASGDLRPARHLAVNLGAPGDMKDDEETVWFAYPNPKTAAHTHFPNYGVKFDLSEQIAPGMGFFMRDFKGRSIAGTDKPWLFTSGCLGLRRCELPLIDAGAGQQGGAYTVRLGFRAPEGDKPGQRVFAIKLQDKVVEADYDIVQRAGQADRAIVAVYKGIPVRENLVVELIPKASPADASAAPILNFIEVRCEDQPDQARQQGPGSAGSRSRIK